MTEFLEILTPWWLASGGTNEGEDEWLKGRDAREAAYLKELAAKSPAPSGTRVDPPNQKVAMSKMSLAISASRAATQEITDVLAKAVKTDPTIGTSVLKRLNKPGLAIADVGKYIANNKLAAGLVALELGDIGVTLYKALFESEPDGSPTKDILASLGGAVFNQQIDSLSESDVSQVSGVKYRDEFALITKAANQIHDRDADPLTVLQDLWVVFNRVKPEHFAAYRETQETATTVLPLRRRA